MRTTFGQASFVTPFAKSLTKTLDGKKYQLTALTIKPDGQQEWRNDSFADRILFAKLRKFHGYLDRRLIGARFHLAKNAHLRTKIIAVCEGTKETGHLHCAISVHETRLPKFREMFPSDLTHSMGKELWTKVSVGGTLQIDEIYDLPAWANYMTKSLYGDDCSDRVSIIL